jgi:hypothetical protein
MRLNGRGAYRGMSECEERINPPCCEGFLLFFCEDIREGRNGKTKPGIEKDGVDDPVFLRFVCYSVRRTPTYTAVSGRPEMS